MKGTRAVTTVAPVAAALSALATLACCLPWGIGAAMGALGLSLIATRFQVEFIALAFVLLGVGIIQILRLRRSCRRSSRIDIALWCVGAAIVLAVVLFPEWVAALLAAHHP